MIKPKGTGPGARSLVAREAEAVRRAIGHQLVAMRTDSGVSQRRLASAADVPQSYISRIERGLADPSTETLVALCRVLGADVSVRLNPGTGPRIRDHIQARIVEELIRTTRPAWRALPEVAVWRPVRGVIDVVLSRPGTVVVACEVHSQIHRLEQLLRWSAAKAEALPSSASWSMLTAGQTTVTVSRLLVLRSTQANRDTVRQFEATLGAAYPARAATAHGSLIDRGTPWPGAAIVWADVASGRARILPRPPRGVGHGR